MTDGFTTEETVGATLALLVGGIQLVPVFMMLVFLIGLLLAL